MIEERSMCNHCPECVHCGRAWQKYKALVCDYCGKELEWAFDYNNEHICEDCIKQVLDVVREEDL